MMQNEHIAIEDLMELALPLQNARVASEETREFSEHLAGCAVCQAELQQLRDDLGLYALASVEPVAPPAGARDRFLAAIGAPSEVALPVSHTVSVLPGPVASTPDTATANVVPMPARRSSAAARVLGWAGWAAAAAAAVIAVGLSHERDALRQELTQQNLVTARLQQDEAQAHNLLSTLTGPSAIHVNLTVPKAAPAPSARATYQQQTGTLLLSASALAPTPAEKVYELWLIPSNGGAPIPAGTFTPDAHGNATLIVPALHGATAAKAFGITLEKAGGATTPTMPILLVGTPT